MYVDENEIKRVREMEALIDKEDVVSFEKALMELDLDVFEEKSSSGLSLINHVILKEKVRLVECLMKHEFNPNAYDAFGPPDEMKEVIRPLFITRNAHIIQLLLDHGADPNAPGKDGITRFLKAIVDEDFDIAAYLLKAGAELNYEYDYGIRGTPFEFVLKAKEKPEKCLYFLLDHGATLDFDLQKIFDYRKTYDDAYDVIDFIIENKKLSKETVKKLKVIRLSHVVGVKKL